MLWQGSVVEIDYGFFRVFGPYFIGKSMGTFRSLIFGLWTLVIYPSPLTKAGYEVIIMMTTADKGVPRLILLLSR